MKISLNKIKSYVNIPADVSDQDLIRLIGSRLVEIEDVIDLAPKYEKSFIVKVVSAEKIPDTHLTLCQIDAGAHTREFSETETVQVVCGAPNVHAGMLAVWLAPGSIVPSTYGNENFKLGKRKLQGYESNGMLAAVDELDLGDNHEGIVEIRPQDAQPGDEFAATFNLNDIILDVENKSLTHRPDCFGLIGFAREIAGILGLKFTEPSWPTLQLAADLPLEIDLTDPEICPRYSCAVFDLPEHEPSKYLTETAVFLAKSGMRTIDPLVDLTNVMMLETGQPLHAFDYDKLVAVGGLETAKIIVRTAQSAEKLQLLDGRTIECIPEDILITSNNTPIALAGAMGGKNTEIDASTTRVVLESATFSLYHLRKTQMAHGIFSEAITRFTKGQPAAMTFPVLCRAVKALEVQPLAVADQLASRTPKNVVKITTDAINQLLGTAYESNLIAKTLENVGFEVRISPLEARKSPTAVSPSSSPAASPSASLSVTVPVWRTDIHLPEDIIEEVGRLLGYDNIPLALPTRSFSATEQPRLWQLKSQLRQILSDQLGMNELLTYSFISRALLEKVGADVAESYEIVNSISPELQCFRQQIVPSLLDKVRENLKAGHSDFTLYELNQVATRSAGLTEEGTPRLNTDLGIVSIGDFYSLKAKILALLKKGLKIQLEYSAITPGSAIAEAYPYLEPLHSAALFYGGQAIGAFGELRASVLRQFKLDVQVSACELNLDSLPEIPASLAITPKISKFPFVERDLTLKVANDAAFGRFYSLIDQVLSSEQLIFVTTPVSIYQSDPKSPTKNLTFHLKFSSPEKTLEQAEISAIIENITTAVTQLGATIV